MGEDPFLAKIPGAITSQSWYDIKVPQANSDKVTSTCASFSFWTCTLFCHCRQFSSSDARFSKAYAT